MNRPASLGDGACVTTGSGGRSVRLFHRQHVLFETDFCSSFWRSYTGKVDSEKRKLAHLLADLSRVDATLEQVKEQPRWDEVEIREEKQVLVVMVVVMVVVVVVVIMMM